MLLEAIPYTHFLEFLRGERHSFIVERKVAKRLKKGDGVQLISFNEESKKVYLIKQIKIIDLNPICHNEHDFDQSAILHFKKTVIF